MKVSELLRDQLKSTYEDVVEALQDLSPAPLNWQPNPTANSIGFTLWHALRTWDWDHARMGGGEELYEKDGWPKRFGFETKGKGMWGIAIGTDFTMDEVKAMPMQPELLRAYADALWARTQRQLEAATDESLTRVFEHQWRPGVMLTPAKVLSHTAHHTLLHVGEAEFIRGLMPQS